MRSENESDPKLNDSRWRRGEYLPKGAIRDGRIGIGELNRVEQVEELGSELHVQSLTDYTRLLRDRKVNIGSTRPSEEVARQGSIGSQRRIRGDLRSRRQSRVEVARVEVHVAREPRVKRSDRAPHEVCMHYL